MRVLLRFSSHCVCVCVQLQIVIIMATISASSSRHRESVQQLFYNMCTHGKLWQSNLIKNNHRYLHQQQKQSSVETVAYWKVPLLPASVTRKHLLLWKRVVFMAITNISKSFEYYLTNSISNYIDNILSFPFEPGIGFTDFPFAFLFLTCKNQTTVFHEKRFFTAPNEVR